MRTPSGLQSHLRYPLTRLFGSPGNVRVLRALSDGLPDSATQIAKSAGLSPQGTRQVLDVLVSQGVVTSNGSARTRLFELAGNHAFHQPMLELFKAERDSWEALVAGLRDQLSGRSDVEAAWLYGSVARGEDTPASDIDVALLVTRPEVGDDVRNDLMKMEDALGVNVSVSALTPKEIAALPANDAWWADVVRDARVLKGDRPETEMKRVRARMDAT